MPMRPNVPYDPVPSVAPPTQAPDDYLHVNVSPQETGAAVGQALSQAGQQGAATGAEGMRVAQDQIGVINQVAATNAFNATSIARGKIIGDFQALRGLDAVAAQPGVVKSLSDLRTKTIAELPTIGAQRAYAMMTARSDDYTIRDVTSYAAQQLKAAQLHSAQASVATAVGAAGDINTAQDNQRFGEALGTIKYHNYDMLVTQGYGSVAHMDPNTGTVTFDASPQGQQAQAVYTQMNQKAVGAAWETRIKALADNPDHGNVETAWNVFNTNRASIPPEAQASLSAYLEPRLRSHQAAMIGASAIGTANIGYTNFVAARVGAEPITMRPNSEQIANAIYGQESDYGANVATSVTGARGGFQIEPATFAKFARPGESIDSAADNVTVGKRIVADYAARYGNDPERVAVAYFSGPGNVAPPGSPTPWITDSKDPNGESVSSYVGSVVARLGGHGPIPTRADYYRTNSADILEKVRADALSQHPDDPQFADQAVAHAQQQMDIVIRQQQLSDRAASDTVYQAVSGGLSNGKPPTSMAELLAISPQVRSAWEQLSASNPLGANVVENRVLSYNAKHDGRDANTYGTSFYNVFQRIHAADGDPQRITTVEQLYPMLGSGLTMSGLKAAQQELEGRATPDGAAEAAMRTQLFKTAHEELTAGNPVFHIKDPLGEELFGRFMAQAYKQIDADKAKGMTAQQIYDPASPTWVGKGITALKRSPGQIMVDLSNGNPTTNLEGEPMAPTDQGAQPAGSFDLKTKDGIFGAFRAGKFGSGPGAVAKVNQALIDAGLARPVPPAPPAPNPVPLH